VVSVSLEQMVKQAYSKTAVIGDLHVPMMDYSAFEVTKAYLKSYKPDQLVINGDLVDFYSLSVFDKNPDRKFSVQDELDEAKAVLKDLRQTVGKNCDIYFLEGNHENRLQRYLWRNPELEGLRDLQLPKLLGLSEQNVKFIGVSGDYWKKDSGHLKIGDALIMHGDNRLNGASTSRYSGYSAKNTMMGIQQSVMINHVHRLALVHHSTPYGQLVGVECGSLCEPTGTANWQQGFVTFETINGKNENYRLHRIQDGTLHADGYIYTSK